MKRIVLYVLTLVMILSCVTVGASAAADGGVLSVDTTQASVGSTVEVDLNITQNPGIVSIYLDMSYDTTRLELVEIKETGFVGEPNHNTDLTQVPYAITWDGGTLPSNVTATGTLATLVFKVKDDAPTGDAFVTVAEGAGGIINVDLAPVDFAFEAGKVTVTVYVAPESAITSMNVVLGTDITVKCYADLADAHTAAQMKFTMNDKTETVAGVLNQNGAYEFAFTGVAPQCMGDEITAELILGEEVLSTKTGFTIRSYCDQLLASNAAALGMSDAKFAAMKTLVADMLEYGAKAQVYQYYKTNALVNSGIEGKTTFVELTKTDLVIKESALEGVEFTAAGVYFDYVNSLYVKFTAPDMTEDNFYITYRDAMGEVHEYYLSDCTLLDEATSTYVLILDPTYATQFNAVCELEIYTHRSADSTSFKSQQYMTYSVASYVYSMQNKVNGNGDLTAMAELARALYNYGLSAKAFNAAV